MGLLVNPYAFGGLVYASVFTDDFNRSDSTNLGADWTETSGNLAIASNQLTATAAGQIARCNTDLGDTDHWVEWDDIAPTGTPTFQATHGLLRYGDAGTQTFYMARYDRNSGDYQIFKAVAGAFTTLAAVDVGDIAGPIRLGFRVAGDQLALYRVIGAARATVLAVTDSSITTGSHVGVRISAVNGGTGKLDNFEAGTLA